MKLDKYEFTARQLAKELTKRFTKRGTKHKDFLVNDVEQYMLKGHLPYIYGGNSLTEVKHEGIGFRTILVGEAVESVKNAINNGETKKQTQA